MPRGRVDVMQMASFTTTQRLNCIDASWRDAGIRKAWFCSTRLDKFGWEVREDIIQGHGSTVRTRPQIVLGTKKELLTQRLAVRKLDEVLSRINDSSYQPIRIATGAEFAKRFREEVLTKRKPSTACSFSL
jgi:hypothetical protein